MRPFVLVLPLVLVVLAGCASEAPAPPPAEPEQTADTTHASETVLSEEHVRLISVQGALKRRDAEISGMAWFGEQLVLLPQHPRRFSTCGGDGCIFRLSRTAIERALDRDDAAALEAEGITLVTNGVESELPGFEGYEGIAFHGDRAFLTIETRTTQGMRGYAVRGRMSASGRRLSLDAESLVELPRQVDAVNMSYESLTWGDDRLLVMHEANGTNVNPYPKSYVFDDQLQPVDTLRFPTMEYRVTDATAPDADGRFWVINYFYPGEKDVLNPAFDSLRARYGKGTTHGQSETVERIVPLRVVADHIEQDAHPPILLRLADGFSRNWEGIAHLRGRGFLLVTDTYPETMLAFVAHTESPQASR